MEKPSAEALLAVQKFLDGFDFMGREREVCCVGGCHHLMSREIGLVCSKEISQLARVLDKFAEDQREPCRVTGVPGCWG